MKGDGARGDGAGLPPGTLVLPDGEAVARDAADRLVAICDARPEGPIAVALCGGSSPQRLYELLAGSDYAGRLPWARLHWFLGDDRAVPPDDPRSNARMVRERFGHGTGAAPPTATHLHVPATDGDLDAGARAYDRRLRDFYGADRLDPARPLFDLVLLGLGTDGHTASLFPGKPALDEQDAWVAPVPEAGADPFVPRLSLTLPALAASAHLLFLVTGANKHPVLARIAAGDDLPAARVTSRGRMAWLVDAAAAGG